MTPIRIHHRRNASKVQHIKNYISSEEAAEANATLWRVMVASEVKMRTDPKTNILVLLELQCKLRRGVATIRYHKIRADDPFRSLPLAELNKMFHDNLQILRQHRIDKKKMDYQDLTGKPPLLWLLPSLCLIHVVLKGDQSGGWWLGSWLGW